MNGIIFCAVRELMSGQLKALIVCCFIIGCFCRQSASAEMNHDLQLWTPITLDVPIHRKVHGYFEVGPRIGDNVSNLYQLLIRPGIEYRFNNNFSFFTGYLWQTTYGTSDGVLHENRIWQQILLDKDIKRLSIINRTRLEQRMFSNLAGTGNRLRHMIKLNLDLNRRLYATTSNELFVNLNSVKDGPRSGIDQNRFFVGLGIKAYKNSRVEAGYQYQYVNRTDEFDDQANHAILIQTFIGLRD
ncbi:MAG: DUF2490 domain-containing protein [Candidatus Obscuribacterales bacterium]|nr:DUF2490 domain-containing protein [Candidatus Obscuribacterales bacterium]